MASGKFMLSSNMTVKRLNGTQSSDYHKVKVSLTSYTTVCLIFAVVADGQASVIAYGNGYIKQLSLSDSITVNFDRTTWKDITFTSTAVSDGYIGVLYDPTTTKVTLSYVD